MEVEATTEHPAEHRFWHFGEEVRIYHKPAKRVGGYDESYINILRALALFQPGIIYHERDLAVADIPARVGHGGRGGRGGPVL